MFVDPAILCFLNADLHAAGWYKTAMSPDCHHVVLAESQHHVINPTNPRSTLDDGVEHRLNVRW